MAGTTVRSRRLAGLLAGYRRAAGLTQPAVARHLHHTVQWVSRTEHAATCRPSVGDVRSLLALYGVTDPAKVAEAVALAADARKPGWWQGYELSQKHAAFVALEAEAAEVHGWQPSVIPGLLQVRGYARAVIMAGPDYLDPGRVEELVRVRSQRQKILCREEPLRLSVVIDEAAVRRPVGPPALMAGQLAHLLEQAKAPNVTIRVLPSTAGPHPGITGPFVILRYPVPDPDVLYTETVAGGQYEEDPAVVERAHRTFARLSALSLTPGETMTLVARVAAGL